MYRIQGKLADGTDSDLWIKARLVGTCTKRSLYGHYLSDGKCIQCGITSAQLDAKFKRLAPKS